MNPGSPPYSAMWARTHATARLQSTMCSGHVARGLRPVVDGDGHPASPGQLVQQGQALLALVADHPGPAVDVDKHGRSRGRVDAPADDVEAMRPRPVTRRSRCCAPPAPSGPGGATGTRGAGSATWCRRRARGDRPRPQAGRGISSSAAEKDAPGAVDTRAWTHEPGPGDGVDPERHPARPGPERALERERHGGGDLPHDVPHRHLGGVPAGEEARHRQDGGAAGRKAFDHQQGAHEADGQVDPRPCHGTILAHGGKMAHAGHGGRPQGVGGRERTDERGRGRPWNS